MRFKNCMYIAKLGEFLETLVLYRMRSAQLPEPTYPPTMGRIRYSTSVYGPRRQSTAGFWVTSAAPGCRLHPSTPAMLGRFLTALMINQGCERR
jgi:hypothetical protein